MKKLKFLFFLVIVLIVMLVLEHIIDDIILPDSHVFEKIFNIFTWILILFCLIFPWISIKTFKITIKSKTSVVVGLWTHKAIKTTDKEIFLNLNDIIPWKRHSDKLQQKLQFGKTYIIRTYRPWPIYRNRNILSATPVIQRKKKK